jgi:hypothetical protein
MEVFRAWRSRHITVLMHEWNILSYQLGFYFLQELGATLRQMESRIQMHRRFHYLPDFS